MKRLLFFGFCLAALASCNQGKEADGKVAKQLDSLNQVIAQRDTELDDLMATMNEIEEGFREINEAEGRVSLAKQGEGANREQRIRENMQFIQSTMKQNRELIEKLQKQLRQSSINSDELKRTIANLTKQLEEKDKEIQNLRAELDAKNIHISELDEQIANLSTSVNSLTTEGQEKSQRISKQDEQLNTGWYVFGTKKELREQNILDGGEVLRSDFNRDYFTKVDIRVTKEIKLYSSSAKMLTSHPESSYTLQRDANKQYVLRITNPQSFWSTSKYLVIQVK